LNRQVISETLKQAGISSKSLIFAVGSELLLLPSGGRVLGLFPSANEDSFFWMHPALASAESTRALFSSEDWCNPGGDRTWLAPEIDVFFPAFPDTNVYHVPKEIDPGTYGITGADSKWEFQNKFRIQLSRSREWVSGVISKSWLAAVNPLRHENHRSKLQYAGYTQHTKLQIHEKATSPVGIWNLLQLPPDGEILIPTYSQIEPYIYVGTVEKGELKATEHLIRYRIARRGINKIGIPAVASTGRIGYLYTSGSDDVLIVRNFSVDPLGEYIDLPWNSVGAIGPPVFSTQACFVDCSLGRFAEIEYHAPVVPGQTLLEDVSQVWAFRGEPAAIRAVGRQLLSAER
jgi:hypothetical protein